VLLANNRDGSSSNDGELALAASFLCGATAGAIAALLTTPFDVLKTRRQVEHGASQQPAYAPRASGVSGVRQPSTFAVLKGIVETEGVGALFSGLAPRVAKVAPSCAIMIGSYEFGKAFFARRRADERAADSSTSR
jgi:solute carrier family 25 protein 39/40